MKAIVNIFKHMEGYDAIATSVIPGYETIQEMVVAQVALHHPSHAPILDLGCGTGQTMQRLLQHLPQCTVQGVDSAPAMLEQARTRLAAYPTARWALDEGDLTQWQPTQPRPTILSIATFNNISHEYLPGIYTAIAKGLTPGGHFIYADFIAHENALVHQKLEAAYDQQLERAIASQQFVRDWIAHSTSGYYPATLSQHCALLSAAGFHTIDIISLHNNFAILSMRTPQ